MYKIIVVDDDNFNLNFIEDILKDEYNVVLFKSGEALLSYLKRDTADLILLDYVMPDMNGIQVLSSLRADASTASIPVVILTADQNVAVEIAFFKMGAEDFITKPLSPEVVRSRIHRILELNALKANLQSKLDEKTRQMENVMLQAFTTVANIIDSKEDFTEEHSVRVAQYAARIAKELGWRDKEIYNIYYAGLLHDIGKIGVPDRIIRKTCALNEKEMKVFRGHTTIGAEILKDVRGIKRAAAVALYHHERYDGEGYPMGIKGEEIPIDARIVHLVDAYDVLTADLKNTGVLTQEQAVQELIKNKGTAFDPQLVDIIVKLIREKQFNKIDALPEGLQNQLHENAEESSQLLFKVLEANSKAVKREAMKDSLTGLYNRSYAEKYVQMYLNQKDACAYIMIDLDNFKEVNDTYGHIAGDYALKNIANMLTEIAENIGIACRLGGDEFSLFIHQDVDRTIVHKIAASMLSEYEKVKAGNASIAETSLSIGIALAPEDGTTYEELYNAADKALYLSKRGGKNQYCFYSDGIVAARESVEHAMDIHQLKELMQIGRPQKGSFKVQYKEFKRIYNFIVRCMERNQQNAQLLLFSLRAPDKNLDSPEALEEELQSLEKAIVNSLRRNDVSTRYSSSQLLVILTDSKAEFVDTIIQRILDNYEAMQLNHQYEVVTECMSIDESLRKN